MSHVKEDGRPLEEAERIKGMKNQPLYTGGWFFMKAPLIFFFSFSQKTAAVFRISILFTLNLETFKMLQSSTYTICMYVIPLQRIKTGFLHVSGCSSEPPLTTHREGAKGLGIIFLNN